MADGVRKIDFDELLKFNKTFKESIDEAIEGYEQIEKQINNICSNYKTDLSAALATFRDHNISPIINQLKNIGYDYSRYIEYLVDSNSELDTNQNIELTNKLDELGLGNVGSLQQFVASNSELSTGQKRKLTKNPDELDLANIGDLKQSGTNNNQVQQNQKGNNNIQAGRDIVYNGNNYSGVGSTGSKGTNLGSVSGNNCGIQGERQLYKKLSLEEIVSCKLLNKKPEENPALKIGAITGGAAQAKINLVNNIPSGAGGSSSVTNNYNAPIYNSTPKPTGQGNGFENTAMPSVNAGHDIKNSPVGTGNVAGNNNIAQATNGSSAVAQTGLLNDNSHDIVGTIVGDLDQGSHFSGSDRVVSGENAKISLNQAGLGLLGLGAIGAIGIGGYGAYHRNKKREEQE